MFSHVFVGVSDFDRAYFRDPDGNKFRVACHSIEEQHHRPTITATRCSV
jgi:hypothetical protein